MVKQTLMMQRAGAVLLLLIGTGLAWGGPTLPYDMGGGVPVLAQRVDPDEAWRQVYERVPDLPKENQYVSKETGKVASDDTLVSRFIRYHIYVKGRSPRYRFDWKLTMADYLGINGLFDETNYPSRIKLRSSPLEGDRAAINRLTRTQRNAMIQAIVDIFSPSTGSRASDNAAPSATTTTAPRSSTALPPIPAPVRGPGSAPLLQP